MKNGFPLHYPLPDELISEHLRGSRFRPSLCCPGHGAIYLDEKYTKEKADKPRMELSMINIKFGFTDDAGGQRYFTRDPSSVTCKGCLEYMGKLKRTVEENESEIGILKDKTSLYTGSIDEFTKQIEMYENRMADYRVAMLKLVDERSKRKISIENLKHKIRLLKYRIAVKKSIEENRFLDCVKVSDNG